MSRAYRLSLATESSGRSPQATKVTAIEGPEDGIGLGEVDTPSRSWPWRWLPNGLKWENPGFEGFSKQETPGGGLGLRVSWKTPEWKTLVF